MAETPAYSVTHVADLTYLDKNGSPINGYELTVYLPEFDETTLIKVPTISPKDAKKAINLYLTARREIAELKD